MTLIDLATADAVQKHMAAPRYVSGGSVANTTAGIAELGGTAGFVGAVADDEIGRTYTENLRAAGVEFEPHYSESAAADGLGTGRCMVLITEDADRTMGTYLGAASTLSSEGVPTSLVARASIVLLEGYLWDVPAAKEAMRHAAATAHAAEGSVALSLSDPFLRGAGTGASSSTCCSTTSTSCSATRRRSPCSSAHPRTGPPSRRRRRRACSSS